MCPSGASRASGVVNLEIEASSRTAETVMSRETRMSAGRQLKAFREAKGLGLRDVERDSQHWADDLHQNAYLVSHNYLAEVEADLHQPSVFKLYTLSALYDVDLLQLLALYGMSAKDIVRAELGLELSATSSGDQATPVHQELVKPTIVSPALPGLDQTRLLFGGTSLLNRGRAKDLSTGDRSLVLFGMLGLMDLTMDPLIPPGSLLQIDSGLREVETAHWRNEYERPIYFVKEPRGYACGWCEVGEANLSLIPHPLSPVRLRRFRYPGEVEIIGRVTAVTMSLIRTKNRPAEFARE